MARNVDREGPIQKAIFTYLKTQYPKALIFSVPNELASKVGGGGKQESEKARRQIMIRNIQAKAKLMGMLPGMADLCMLLEGSFYAFEVKAKGNKQQTNQQDAEYAVDTNGGYYFVVRSIDDVKEAMQVRNLATDIPHRGEIG